VWKKPVKIKEKFPLRKGPESELEAEPHEGKGELGTGNTTK
jgi:hypothetical protein